MATIPKKIKDDFVVGKKIGGGAFGEVHEAKFHRKNGAITDVAIKFEPVTAQKQFIAKEIGILRSLKGNVGFAKCFGCGIASGFNFVAMQLLGSSLAQLLDKHGPFQLETVCQIGTQMVDRLEILHQKNWIHSDLKPDNIVIGQSDQSVIYLIDFGLATKFEIADTPQKSAVVGGNSRFMSVGAHERFISFQNDIESLGFLLAYLVKEELPWDVQQIACMIKKMNNREIFAAVLETKKVQFQHLLQTLPKPIATFLATSRCITHTEKPDYNVLRNILK